MATAASEIVTDDEVKFEVRVDGDDLDTEISNIRGRAIAWVTRQTGLPLIDWTKAILRYPRNSRNNEPIFVGENYVRSVEVKYWVDSQEGIRVDPAGTVAGVGRLFEVDAGGTLIYPPEAGWPERREPQLWINATLGVDATEDMKLVVLAVCRHFWDGQPNMPETLTTLVRSLTDYRV